ncbi:MAG: Fic family protein [Candidatus Neomarinimicrobiota bacterium]|nr:MAG: Fic family protein [Candidatus Neomarinimicrobiota bacterium]
MKRKTGIYEITSVAGENVKAFIPHELPPCSPKIKITGGLASLLQAAETNIARLEAAGQIVPSLDWFVYAFVRKEAVISSQIEGTQASLVDLLELEADATTEAPPEHVEEICNYLEALKYARKQLQKKGGLPLSTRLFNGSHKRLMSGTRGQHKQPGLLRRSQNWIGGTRPGNASFVPPAPHHLSKLLGHLEKYLNSNDSLPPLIKAGLVHAQFETIHPYLDGNGRLGRLLITLCLEEWGLLSEPMLYLSLFFKRHREEYYKRLSAIRTDGDWEGWLAYFLEGVAVVSDESVRLVAALFETLSRDRIRYLESGTATVVGARLFESLPQNPIVTVKSAVRICSTTRPTAAKAINSLVDSGVLTETSGRSRDRAYSYGKYLKHLREGTEIIR